MQQIMETTAKVIYINLHSLIVPYNIFEVRSFTKDQNLWKPLSIWVIQLNKRTISEIKKQEYWTKVYQI